MPHRHGDDNCRPRFCNQDSLFDLLESRSLTYSAQQIPLHIPAIAAKFMYIQSWADGDNGHVDDGDGDSGGDGDGGGDGFGVGVGDHDHSTRMSKTSGFAMSMSASKLLQT
jgi:hypothetical protein